MSEILIPQKEIIDALLKTKDKYMTKENISLDQFAKVLSALDEVAQELGIYHALLKERSSRG